MADHAEIDHLIDELQQAFEGDPWHGSSVMSLLEGVSATEAAARPLPDAHTIWELVLHMDAWVREVTRRLAGGDPRPPEGGEWPEIEKACEGTWRQAVADLRSGHEDLVANLAGMRPERLDAVVGGGAGRVPDLGTGVTVRAMIRGVSMHDAYHSGQVALLRKAIASGPGGGSES